MLEISREYKIQAAHQLPNVCQGHKCGRLHGHTWVVRVWITGPVGRESGWVIDYADLDVVWAENVDARLDHSLLNNTIQNPTTERIAQWLYGTLANALVPHGVSVTEIVVNEGLNGECRLRAELAASRVKDLGHVV